MNPAKNVPLLLLACVVCIGAFLRLNQFSTQVLLDDEWHAVHQLLSGKSPAELFLTLGIADYSIPLGLYYNWYADHFGLSEGAMRAPMLLASLLAVPLFALWAWRRFGGVVAVVFAAFLAVSPMLIIYAHTARPYSLTLLLSYLGLVAFFDFLDHKNRWLSGAIGCVAMSMSVWLHLITGPFFVAPYLIAAISSLWKKDWPRLGRMMVIGVLTLLATTALVLPPVLADAQSLVDKSGLAELDLQTAVGVWFTWFGSGNPIVVAFMVVLTALGLKTTLREPVAQSALLGIVITLLAIFASQPQWVQHPVTMARYLLPAIPMLLLAAANGIVKLRPTIRLVGITAVMLACASLSTGWRLAVPTNNQMTHLLLQIDFREQHNPVQVYQQEKIPLSDFWRGLADYPTDQLEIVAAPFHFESYNWDAPRWERASGQRVYPGAFAQFCANERWGEVPKGSRFRFSNVFYLSDLELGDRPDWLVYNKPFMGFRDGLEDQWVGDELSDCAIKLREFLGPPSFEDDALMAWEFTQAD